MSSVVFYAVLAIDYIAVAELSAAPLVDMQSAHTLAGLAEELIAEHIQFHAVEALSSVRDRLRREGV